MDPAVAVALITAGSAVAVALITRGQRKTRRAVEIVHDEVRTNDGKRAGQRLEELPEILAVGLQNMGQVLADALADHTASDAENFEELRSMMKDQAERSAEYASLQLGLVRKARS